MINFTGSPAYVNQPTKILSDILAELEGKELKLQDPMDC